jgi:hypothetical protein
MVALKHPGPPDITPTVTVVELELVTVAGIVDALAVALLVIVVLLPVIRT